MSPGSEFQVERSDCCGNGCANCILDSVPRKLNKLEWGTKTNILLQYREYEILKIIEIRPEILNLQVKFAHEDARDLSDFILYVPSGHHVMMRAPITTAVSSTETNSKIFITRPYSPFFTDPEKFEFKILVNLQANGQMSRFIRQLKCGDKIEFRGPIGSFEHAANSYENLLIFCHGVAIAPVLTIIREILDNNDDMTRIKLFACFRNVEEILFRQELYDFNAFWNFAGRIYLSTAENNFRDKLKYKENVVNGRLNKVEVKEILTGCCNKKAIRVVVCGSKKFEEFLVKVLLDDGVDRNVIDIL